MNAKDRLSELPQLVIGLVSLGHLYKFMDTSIYLRLLKIPSLECRYSGEPKTGATPLRPLILDL